ncbi:MAG TPA: thioredoxin family protein [Stellaceae bacterium]|nr:thioredoxin family protein [Stellaceae bacterium]
MTTHKLVSHDEWIEERKRLLATEKEFTRQRDRLSAERRELPWVRVDKAYRFDAPEGSESLGDLFAGRHQLIVYHFMFDTSWEAGCKSCSFWADNFDGIVVHLRHRDVTLVAVSRAPLAKLQAYKKRMGWHFKWVSSEGNSFNRDYHVTHTPEELAAKDAYYNYTRQRPYGAEAPGISVFYRDDDGGIYHTYSCYARGLDMLNGAYHLLDLVPKGRDEENLPFHTDWLRRHDEYPD